MKNSLFKIIAFLAVIIIPPIVWFGIKLAAPEVANELDFDLGEKREKSVIESVDEMYLSSDAINSYVADRAPFRSVLITWYQETQGKLEKPYENSIKPSVAELLFGKTNGESIEVSDAAFSSLFGNDKENEAEATNNNADNDSSFGNEQQVEEIPEPEIHDYIENVTLEPTCTEQGEAEYICSICGDSYTVSIPANGHDFVALATTQASYVSYGYTDYSCSVCGKWNRDDWVSKLVDDSYFAPNLYNDVTIVGRFGWLFLGGYGNLPYYKGTNILTEEEMEEYTEKLVSLQQLCEEKGKTLAVLFAPNKDQVYSEYMPSYTVETDYKRTQMLVDYIKENSEVPIAYPLEEIKYCDRYWQTYLKYDTHWNKMGAFIAEQSLLNELGMETTDPLSLTINALDTEGWGDLVTLGGLDNTDYPPDRNYIISYKPEVNVTVVSGNYESNIYRAKSDSANEQKVVLLGDSYRAAMSPALERDFSEVVISHRDYVDSVVGDVKDADVIVLMAVERYDSRIFPTADRIMEILSEE